MIYKREIDTAYVADVVVAGAGPAGICAAVAAARQGMRVILIERFGAVGGNPDTWKCKSDTRQRVIGNNVR